MLSLDRAAEWSSLIDGFNARYSPTGHLLFARPGFYSENFGWKLNQLGPEMGNYVLVHTGPTDEKGMPQDRAFINGGLMKRDPSASSPVLVIAVGDADATVDKIKKSGGKLVGEIMDIPNVGRYARVRDTEGNVIGVIKPTMP